MLPCHYGEVTCALDTGNLIVYSSVYFTNNENVKARMTGRRIPPYEGPVLRKAFTCFDVVMG